MQFQRPVDNYSGGPDTSGTPFIIILDSKIHFLRVFFEYLKDKNDKEKENWHGDY